jgi:hypothetical protein
VRGDLERVNIPELAGQRVFQLLAGRLEPLVSQRGQRRRAVLPAREGIEEPPPADAEQVRDHHRDLQQRVLEDFLHPGLVPRLVLGQPGPGAGQHPQVPHRLRRHERAAQHAPLVQLGEPHAVGPVALAPSGQVLHIAGVDQPYLQAGRLGQVVPDAPVIRGALQHQPLDPLPGTRVHTIPDPLATSIAAARSTTRAWSSDASAPAPSCSAAVPAPGSFFLAAIAASLSLACQQERGCPGSGTGESRI